MVYENWRILVDDEIIALNENGTWTMEELPLGKTALGCKWGFRLIFRAYGIGITQISYSSTRK